MVELYNFFLIDASAFIEQLFSQGRHEKYEEKIKELIDRGHKAVITPIIIKEIVDSILEQVRKQEHDKESSIIDYGKKIMCQEYHSHFHHFNQLTQNYGCKIIHPEGNKFIEILNKCDKLRLGDKKSDQDKLNIAIAISDGCKFFVTGDESIFEEQRTISQISENGLKIIHIKK